MSSSINRPKPGTRQPNLVTRQAAAVAAAKAEGKGTKKTVGQSYNALAPKTRLLLAASLTTFALAGLYLEKFILPEGGQGNVVDYVPAGSGVGWEKKEEENRKRA